MAGVALSTLYIVTNLSLQRPYEADMIVTPILLMKLRERKCLTKLTELVRALM